MNKNKISEAQLRAKSKWAKENTYSTSIHFYKKDFPKEKFEKAKEEIRKMGMSQNEFYISKLKELLGDDKNG